MINFRNQEVIAKYLSKATKNEKNLKQFHKTESIKITRIHVICFI